MRLLTPKGYLIEEQGMSYLTDTDPEAALRPLQAAACTYRIALGPRGGQKVLSLQTVPSQTAPPTQQRCVSEQGFSLHAEVCCAAHQRHKPESRGQRRVPERQRGCVRTPAKQAGSWPGPKAVLLGAPRMQHLCRYITRPALANERLNAIAPAVPCCNSRRPTKTAPRIL